VRAPSAPVVPTTRRRTLAERWTRGRRSTSRRVARSRRALPRGRQTFVAEGTPPILGNAGKLQQVLLNLIGNAVQAVAGDREGRVCGTARGEDRRVALRVEDDGPGAPVVLRSRIFDPFYTWGRGPVWSWRWRVRSSWSTTAP